MYNCWDLGYVQYMIWLFSCTTNRFCCVHHMLHGITLCIINIWLCGSMNLVSMSFNRSIVVIPIHSFTSKNHQIQCNGRPTSSAWHCSVHPYCHFSSAWVSKLTLIHPLLVSSPSCITIMAESSTHRLDLHVGGK